MALSSVEIASSWHRGGGVATGRITSQNACQFVMTRKAFTPRRYSLLFPEDLVAAYCERRAKLNVRVLHNRSAADT
jgi:hypothetical protein